MGDALIQFHADPELLGKIPQPYPAARVTPEWLREMPASSGQLDTVKRCIPFLDAMTAGYIIPLTATVTVQMSEAGELRVVESPQNMVETHPPAQFPGSPFAGSAALKFNSPWCVKTPAGYSTLFVSPLNSIELPIMPLAGVVDTDQYYAPMSFPALYLLPPGSEFTIPRGTALVQAIPFRREPWRHAIAPVDSAARGVQVDRIRAAKGYYRENHWQKKSFM